MIDFMRFSKIARLSRDIVITEKIDGTNAQICIGDDGEFVVGSRNRWITPENDNYGFAKWAMEHKEELLQLGTGRHFGEWWGSGIQRRYGLDEKRFSLFNVHKWNKDNIPECCYVVPILFEGMFDTNAIMEVLKDLQFDGSYASPGFNDPEGIIIFHTASNTYYKKTIKNDEKPKGMI